MSVFGLRQHRRHSDSCLRREECLIFLLRSFQPSDLNLPPLLISPHAFSFIPHNIYTHSLSSQHTLPLHYPSTPPTLPVTTLLFSVTLIHTSPLPPSPSTTLLHFTRHLPHPIPTSPCPYPSCHTTTTFSSTSSHLSSTSQSHLLSPTSPPTSTNHPSFSLIFSSPHLFSPICPLISTASTNRPSLSSYSHLFSLHTASSHSLLISSTAP